MTITTVTVTMAGYLLNDHSVPGSKKPRYQHCCSHSQWGQELLLFPCSNTGINSCSKAAHPAIKLAAPSFQHAHEVASKVSKQANPKPAGAG